MANETNNKTSKMTKTTQPERQTERKGPVGKSGNLTRDPDLHFSYKNTAYCRFGLAVERPKEPGNWAGELVPDFCEVTCFGTLAEHVAQSLAKGARAVVVGRAELEHWTDDDGKPRTTKRILADGCGPDLRWATAVVTKVKPKTRQDISPDGYPTEEPF
jgi:single-strand DNA-binding protein